MPIVTGRSAGGVPNTGVHSELETAALAANATTNSSHLHVPGLPRLAFLIIQNAADVVGFSIIPEGAFQRGGTPVIGATLTFHPLGPAVLIVPGVATRIEVDMPCEAIRLALVTTAANAGTETATIILAASA